MTTSHSRWRSSSPRAAWFAARARNASRRRWRIAAFSLLATIATALALVLVPQTVDGRWRAQLSQLPPARDTSALLEQLAALAERRIAAERLENERIQALLQDTLRADSVSADSLRTDSLRAVPASPRDSAAVPPINAPTAGMSPAAASAASADLARRLRRARTVPLTESYRELGAAPLLRNEARVRVLLDSIEAVNQERDAFAALGGADARYAALTERLSALGQRLVRFAESRLAEARVASRQPVAATADSTAPTPASGATDSLAGIDSVMLAAPEIAHAEFLARERARTDTLLQWTIDLDAARRENDELLRRRRAIESRLTVAAPLSALALAALVVGVTLGFAVVMAGELRRPTVGDDREVERITQARVIASRGPRGSTRRKPLESIRQLLDDDRTAYELLHLTLTGIGEVARRVHVIADDPSLASVVAINLAAAAARDSRAALVVEDPLAGLRLQSPKLTPVGIAAANASTDAPPSVRSLTLSRDVTIDVLPAINRGADALPIADQHDLTLLPGDLDSIRRASADGIISPDVLLCVQPGITSLAWLAAAARMARADGRRIRAVLRWSAEPPYTLSPAQPMGYSPPHVG